MSAHLIDDVARRMTDVAPRADLRARVVAQLRDRPTPWRAWLPAMATATALVVAAAGAVVSRPELIRRDVTPPGTAALPVVAAPTVTAHVDTGAPAQEPLATPRRGARKTAPKPEVLSAAEAAWRLRAIPVIEGAAPLTTEDIQPQSLRVPLLELKPLVTLPVIVAPISAADHSGR